MVLVGVGATSAPPSMRVPSSPFSAVALPFNGPGDGKMGFTFVRLKDRDRPHVRDVVGGSKGLGGRLFFEVEGAISIPILPKAVFAL